MIASLLTTLGMLFSVVGKIFDWFRSRDLMNAGKAQAELEALRKQVREGKIADAAREAQRAADAAGLDGTGKLPDNDPFRRD